MSELLEFLTRYGYVVVFTYVLADQAGLPLPSLPLLMAAGALAAGGQLSVWLVIGFALLASLIGDALWFGLGRYRGRSVLNLVCRISLDPDSCVRRAQDSFERHGARLLLFSKFLPGVGTAAPPLSAIVKMSFPKFLLWDALGSVLWAGSSVALGYVFRAQLEEVALYGTRLGAGLLLLLALGLVAYIVQKFIARRRFLRMLRIDRITPEELMRSIEEGPPMVIVDLRHRLDLAILPERVPGAVQIAPEDFAARHQDIPRDREVVLYCSCPSEATSAHVALQLRNIGIVRVRPLAGGFEAWRSAGFPVEPLIVASAN
jgi:membrane protein DedA with SNARE-associated domain/rhodanese-related sulfurtransferase